MLDGKRQKTGLTAAWVSRAKPKDKPYKLSDRDGLYLLVEPSGLRVWRMNYRFFGKQKTITFGRWPELLLGDARERLLDARRLLSKGVDPVEQAKLEKIGSLTHHPHRGTYLQPGSLLDENRQSTLSGNQQYMGATCYVRAA